MSSMATTLTEPRMRYVVGFLLEGATPVPVNADLLPLENARDPTFRLLGRALPLWHNSSQDRLRGWFGPLPQL